MIAVDDEPDLVLITYGPEPMAVNCIASNPPSVLVATPKGQVFEARSGRHIDAFKEMQAPSKGHDWFRFHLYPR